MGAGLNRRQFAFAAAIIVASAGSVQIARAALLIPTITDSSPSQPGFEVANFIDNNPATDYASNTVGVGTFVNFKFPNPTLILDTDFTDRTSSGGANGSNTKGPQDNVTQYKLVFSQDSIFGNGDDQTVTFNSPNSANNDGVVSLNGGIGISAQFVRYQVTAINNASPGNVGGAELHFFGANAAAWPVYDLKADGSKGDADRKLLQGFGDGSNSSRFVNGMHEGIDVIADGHGGQEVDAARAGTVIEVNPNASGGIISVLVNVGTAAEPIMETDTYVHVGSIPNTVTVNSAVALGTKLGNTSTTAFADGSRHFHLSVFAGAVTGRTATVGTITTVARSAKLLLNPLARFTDAADRDPGGNLPVLADTNVDGKSIVFTTSGTVTPVAAGAISGSVDLVADVRDNMNANLLSASGPYKVGYYIKNLAVAAPNHSVRTAADPYIVTKFDDTFFANGGNALPAGLNTSIYATTPAFIVTTDNTKAGFNPTIFPLTKNYIVTNTKGNTGSVANVDAAQFWNTAAADNAARADTDPLANMSDTAAAAKNANARFKDGDYEVHIVAADLTHPDQDLNAGKIRVTNFPRAAAPGLGGAAPLPNPGLLPALFDESTPFAAGYAPVGTETATIAATLQLGDELSAAGDQYYPNFEMPVYVEPDQSWSDGMPLDGPIIGYVMSDDTGFIPLTMTDYIAELPGTYDMIIDYDRDSAFSLGLDGLTAFTVVPEPASATLLLSLTAISFFNRPRKSQRRRS